MTKSREEKLRKVAQQRQAEFIVVLEDIHDPHNAAAILRTCDAFGVQDVWFVFVIEKRYNPRRVGKSSSSSANKWLSFRVFTSNEECGKELRKLKYESIGTVLADDTEDMFKMKLTAKKIALWVGNEHRGLSPAAIAQCDRRLLIPMRGMVQSMNVSVTTAICIYEITRQRQEHGRYLLPKSNINYILKDWAKK